MMSESLSFNFPAIIFSGKKVFIPIYLLDFQVDLLYSHGFTGDTQIMTLTFINILGLFFAGIQKDMSM